MAISSHTQRVLTTALGIADAANEIVAALNSSVASPAGVVAAIGTTTDLTAVPGSFANLAAVQTYLAGSGAVPLIESRLDVIEAKVDALIAALKLAGLMSS